MLKVLVCVDDKDADKFNVGCWTQKPRDLPEVEYEDKWYKRVLQMFSDLQTAAAGHLKHPQMFSDTRHLRQLRLCLFLHKTYLTHTLLINCDSQNAKCKQF